MTGYLRYRLLKSFLVQHPSIGLSKAEVEEILGPGDSSSDEKMTYALGRDLSLFGMDNLWIDFLLKDGKVTKYQLYGD